MIIKRVGSLLTTASLNPNNVWAGSAFEYLRGPSFLSIGIMTPGTAGGLLAAQYVGSALIAEEFEVPFRAPTVDGSNQPDMNADMFLQAGGVGGDRLVTTLRNPTGGTLTYTALAIIQPAGGGRRGR
jgi:hypothetical protein